MVDCPVCGNAVKEANINSHLDSGCQSFIDTSAPETPTTQHGKPLPVASFFRTPLSKKAAVPITPKFEKDSLQKPVKAATPEDGVATTPYNAPSTKRAAPEPDTAMQTSPLEPSFDSGQDEPPTKKQKPVSNFQRAAPLAERMRPRTLDEVYGQDLVGPTGVLRGLIETDRVPSMILWGGPGTGKTTIARVIAHMVGSRFAEINSTSSGVGECKKLFAEARGELGLTGRKTIIFCDEIHRFSKSQQDVFLGPVESGQVTLIGATTENPSFKVQNALLSRCRTFTLKKLEEKDVEGILRRALEVEGPNYGYRASLVDDELVKYLAAFAEGDARTALNLLELAMNLSTRPDATQEGIKSALTKTLVYDRAGDQHCRESRVTGRSRLIKSLDDTISAFHKSVRGSDASAALYYLARMLQSGEDPLYIAVSPCILFQRGRSSHVEILFITPSFWCMDELSIVAPHHPLGKSFSLPQSGPEILSRAFLLDTIHLKVWEVLADLDLLSAV